MAAQMVFANMPGMLKQHWLKSIAFKEFYEEATKDDEPNEVIIAMVTLAAYAASADTLSERERKEIMNLSSEWGHTKETTEKAIEAGLKMSTDERNGGDSALREKNEQTVIAPLIKKIQVVGQGFVHNVLYDIICIAGADEGLGNGEMDRVRRVAQLLKIEKETLVMDLISMYGQEEALLRCYNEFFGADAKEDEEDFDKDVQMEVDIETEKNEFDVEEEEEEKKDFE